MIRRVIATLAAAVIAGCSGTGAPLNSAQVLPQTVPDANSTGRATLNVTLRIPRHRRNGARGPRYISPSTKSIVVFAKPGKGSEVKAFANTTPTSPDCTGTLLALTCTVSMKLTPATYTLAIATYDATQTSASAPAGHLLSANTLSAKVRAGKKNAIRATLDGIPATVTVTAAANQSNVEGNDGSGLMTLGGSSSTILVAAYDVDGNVIVGGGAPALSIVVSSATGGINAKPVATNPNAFTLSSTGIGSASLVAKATPAGGTAVSVNVAVTAVTTTALLAGVVDQTGHNDGTGTGAHFFYPAGMAYDSSDGSLYVADSFNCTIRKVTTGGVVTTVAGSATHCDSSAGDFNIPAAVAYDPDDGYLYVADSSNCTIDAVPLTTGTFSRIAGLLSNCNNTGTNLNHPLGVAYAGNHTLYVSDTGNCLIRKIATIDTSPTTTTFAGTGSCDNIGFHNPIGIAYDGSGTLYVADEVNCEIRKIVISTVTVSTLAGSSSTCASVDGTGTSATFTQPFGIAYDQSHTALWVTDLGTDEIREVTTAGVVTTFAGAGRPGYQEGSLVQNAMMTTPEGIVYVPGAAGALGSVYFADTANDIVRRLNL